MSEKRGAVIKACSKLDYLYGGRHPNKKAGEHPSTGFLRLPCISLNQLL